MLHHQSVISRAYWRLVAIILTFLFIGSAVRAQQTKEERSFTAPRAIHEWMFLGNTNTSKWEYDQRTMLRKDSQLLRVRLRETPLKNSYCDVRGAKMWEQRSIQGYSDTLRMHPQFYYEGYERYGYTIFEENINLSGNSFAITYAADYDLGGLMLKHWDDCYDEVKPIDAGSPEKMIVDLYTIYAPNTLVGN